MSYGGLTLKTASISYITDPSGAVFKFTANGDFFIKVAGNGIVNWGDGTETVFNTQDIVKLSKTLEEQRQVCIYGTLAKLCFWDIDEHSDIVENFGIVSVDTPFPEGTYTQTGATSLRCCFARCTSLVSVPDDVFKYADSGANNLEKAFYACKSLKTISPAVISRFNIISAQQCFAACEKLERVDDDFFANSAESLLNVNYVFWNCSSATDLPELWDTVAYPSIRSHSNAYRGCTSYADIDSVPTDWK